jgi:hypothetical protein
MEYQISSIEKRFDALEKKVDDMFTMIMTMALNKNRDPKSEVELQCTNLPVINETVATNTVSNSQSQPATTNPHNLISTNRRRTII